MYKTINKPHSLGPEVQTEGAPPPTLGAAIAFATVVSVTTVLSGPRLLPHASAPMFCHVGKKSEILKVQRMLSTFLVGMGSVTPEEQHARGFVDFGGKV